MVFFMLGNYFVLDDLNNKKTLILFLLLGLIFAIFGFVLNVSIIFSLIAFVLFIVFFGLKTLSFFVVLPKEKFSIIEVLGVFFISDFVEIVTLSGKIGSDASKLFFLRKKASLKQLITSIALFRIATFISTGLIILFFINYTFLFLLTAFPLLYFTRFRNIIISTFLNLISDFCRVLLFVLLLTNFGIIADNYLILGFLGASIFARLFFFIPQGLVVQDSAIGLLLSKILTLNEIVSVNVILRFFTIIPSAILGALILSNKTFDKIKDLIKNKKNFNY